MMKRALTMAAILAAALFAGCDRKPDQISKYDPTLDGPTMPRDPTVANALLEGHAGGAVAEAPAPKPPATVPATAASEPTTEPTTSTAPVESSADADKAKSEIDARLDQIKQLLADKKFEEYERAGSTPEEWKAKLDADPQALQKQVDSDVKDPDTAAKGFDGFVTSVKAGKPTLSADGNLATYHIENMGTVVFKKIENVWYFSEAESKKAG